VTGNSILVQKTTDGFHVLLGSLAGHIVHTLLKIVHGDLPEGNIPDRLKLLDGCPVAVHGAFGLFVGRLPLIEDLLEGRLVPLLLPGFPVKIRQILGGFLLRLETGFGGRLFVHFPVFIHGIAQHLYGNPRSVGKLVDAACAVPSGFGFLVYVLPCPAGRAELGIFGQLTFTFPAFHFSPCLSGAFLLS